MRHSEGVLYSHLTNTDSLDIIAREGFNSDDALEVIPTELGRRIVKWCLSIYFESGRLVAPSKQAILDTFGEQMEKVNIEVVDDVETDSVQFAIADLRSHYLYGQVSEFNTRFVTDLYNADAPDRVGVSLKYTSELHKITRAAVSRRNEMTGLEGVDDAILRFKQRAADGQTTMGLTLGLKELDEHLFGVHPGEICTIAAGPGVGKSWTAGFITNTECANSRRCLLVTLENDNEMTFDRLVCMAAGVPYEAWQRGIANDGDMARVDAFRKFMSESERQPIITQLSADEATPINIIRRAQLEDADSVIIDQASHLHPEKFSRAVKRNEQLREIMRDLHTMIRDEYKIPVVLMNQINRDGMTASRKTGRYEMEHLAEGGSVEQASAIVLTIFQSELMRREQMALLQQLKGRRTDRKHFLTNWRPEVGDIRIKREVQLEDAA